MNTTDVVLVAAITSLLAWNVYFAISPTQNTISQRVWKHTGRWPMIPFCVGVVVGHFFW